MKSKITLREQILKVKVADGIATSLERYELWLIQIGALKKMKENYSYCLAEHCIHRRGCKRWVGNYAEKAAKEYVNKYPFAEYIDYEDCINERGDVRFKSLDRFRLSDGSNIK